MLSVVINLHHHLKALVWGLALLSMSACNVTGSEIHTQLPILNRFDGPLGTDHLAWSPDGKHLSFMQGNQPLEPGQLVVLNISTGISKTVGTHQWNYDSPNEWSPDGTQVVVAQNGELWLIQVADGNVVYLTRGEGVAWSPDGQTLAVFRSPLSGGPPDRFQIVFVTPEGKEIDVISAGMIPPPEPTPTPRPTDPNDHELTLMMISRTPYFTGMDWSPDGQSLVYSIVSPEEDRGDLLVIKRDGSGRRRLTSSGYSVEPAWSLGTDRIIYVYSSPYHIPGDLTMTTSKGECHLQLTEGGGVNTPVWSPDGRKIALSVLGTIYILNAEKYFSDEYFDPKRCKQ